MLSTQRPTGCPPSKSRPQFGRGICRTKDRRTTPPQDDRVWAPTPVSLRRGSTLFSFRRPYAYVIAPKKPSGAKPKRTFTFTRQPWLRGILLTTAPVDFPACVRMPAVGHFDSLPTSPQIQSTFCRLAIGLALPRRSLLTPETFPPGTAPRSCGFRGRRSLGSDSAQRHTPHIRTSWERGRAAPILRVADDSPAESSSTQVVGASVLR
jgi:hypothetical protein